MKQLSWLVQRRQHAKININSITSHRITSHHLAPPAWRGWPYSCSFPYSWLTGNSKLIGSPIVIYLLPLALDPLVYHSFFFFVFGRPNTSKYPVWSIKKRIFVVCWSSEYIKKDKKSRWNLAWSWSFLFFKKKTMFFWRYMVEGIYFSVRVHDTFILRAIYAQRGEC